MKEYKTTLFMVLNLMFSTDARSRKMDEYVTVKYVASIDVFTRNEGWVDYVGEKKEQLKYLYGQSVVATPNENCFTPEKKLNNKTLWK